MFQIKHRIRGPQKFLVQQNAAPWHALSRITGAFASCVVVGFKRLAEKILLQPQSPWRPKCRILLMIAVVGSFPSPALADYPMSWFWWWPEAGNVCFAAPHNEHPDFPLIPESSWCENSPGVGYRYCTAWNVDGCGGDGWCKNEAGVRDAGAETYRDANGAYWCRSRVTCPIEPLSPLPNEPCTQSLEAGRGKDVNNACSPGLTPEMRQEEQCLANKIRSLGIPYTEPTATIRTEAYQNHLNEIWDKWRRLQNLPPEQEEACAVVKAQIEAEKGRHGLRYRPPPYDPRDSHVNGRAIDVSEDIVNELARRVVTDSSGLEDYIRNSLPNPPACSLRWGGRFRDYDPVHFQLP